ncbi:hypothetical protein G6Y96_12070 [Clostridium perfringens]|uniref:hypothetical protein n=1 Tax=Clostridium perfringens TaxID=1502 RepID=UPI0013E3691D|nr:hypothetical protein [Clostridium perfringens]NGT12481.1 hypothetical protein [Clostridium perfringens]
MEIIQKLIKLELENKIPTRELIPNPPEFMSTVHNGDRDCIEIVEENSMKIVLDFIINILKELGI